MKTKEVNKLTWKYFIDQKIKEIVGGVLFLSIVLLVLYDLGKLNLFKMCGWEGAVCSSFFGLVIVGFGNLCFILIFALSAALLLLLLFYILYWLYKHLLKNWIKSNWKKAKEKARKELK